ncbi:zinc finger protein with KRAB and SCAN domains 2-like [Malaclemys terrapin pileata]|uniref:zinc finger protein with KRAB and SCAN domains 2-like n=1 Tax=Malaclemys terrapin pileata TaxID=2991368 RepID=UPI0023A82F1A|nr:zinc finger protein with KRAB and SCAN domains 2-like [Malaclemys terrapin pileata]
MPPCTRRAPVWSNGEVLDFISVLGEEAVQSQLSSSCRNYDPFGQISRDMMERGHDQDALQCRIKVKELQNAYRKVHEANNCSGAAPAMCHFYKELDAILRSDPTSTPSSTKDTSEPSSTRQEEEEEVEEQSGSECAEAEEGTPESLDACSQELFSSQEEGSQSWQPVLGNGQTPEEVTDATLRSQPSVLSPSERLQRIRMRPHRSKEDMLHEVMQHSSNENQKVQEWWESERRICQQNDEHRHKSVVLRQKSTDRLISIRIAKQTLSRRS